MVALTRIQGQHPHIDSEALKIVAYAMHLPAWPPQQVSRTVTSHQPLAPVTGANLGIGKEVSRQLATQGFVVPLAARSLFGSGKLIGVARQKMLTELLTNDTQTGHEQWISIR